MEVLFVLLIALACPLMMILMMRGHGHGHSHHAASIAELRRRRDELDREIAEREETVR